MGTSVGGGGKHILTGWPVMGVDCTQRPIHSVRCSDHGGMTCVVSEEGQQSPRNAPGMTNVGVAVSAVVQPKVFLKLVSCIHALQIHLLPGQYRWQQFAFSCAVLFYFKDSQPSSTYHKARYICFTCKVHSFSYFELVIGSRSSANYELRSKSTSDPQMPFCWHSSRFLVKFIKLCKSNDIDFYLRN